MDEQRTPLLPLDIKFKVKDVLRYNLSVARKNIVNCIVLGLGGLVLIYFFYKMFTTPERLDVFIAKNVMLLVVPLLIFMMIPWKVWQITLSQMQQPAFAYGVKYVFSKEHIILDIGEASEEMSWDLFVKIIETKHDFRFYINNISAQIIPKHNMTEEELQILKEIIKEAAPNRCQLK
jgi:hypothetical protein